MNTSLDNIRILHQNNLLLEFLKQQQQKMQSQQELFKDKAGKVEQELLDQISQLKSDVMQLEMKLKNETFSKELIEKELNKKKFEGKMAEGEMKMKNKQLQINLQKAQDEAEGFKSKYFDSREQEKKLAQQIKDMQGVFDKQKEK